MAMKLPMDTKTAVYLLAPNLHYKRHKDLDYILTADIVNPHCTLQRIYVID
jgi:hypothetical protein